MPPLLSFLLPSIPSCSLLSPLPIPFYNPVPFLPPLASFLLSVSLLLHLALIASSSLFLFYHFPPLLIPFSSIFYALPSYLLFPFPLFVSLSFTSFALFLLLYAILPLPPISTSFLFILPPFLFLPLLSFFPNSSSLFPSLH